MYRCQEPVKKEIHPPTSTQAFVECDFGTPEITDDVLATLHHHVSTQHPVHSIEDVNNVGDDDSVGADVFGETALHRAACYGMVDRCEELLKLGAQVDCLNSENNTPLLCAAEFGYSEVCGVLLEHGADKDHVNWLGFTALDITARLGHLQAVDKPRRKIQTSSC